MKSKTTNKNIPVYTIDKKSAAGVVVQYFSKHTMDDRLRTAHRDDNFVFIQVEKGSLQVEVDFDTFTLTEGEIFLIFPGQVHRGMITEGLKGCGVAAISSVIPQHIRTFFEQCISPFKPVLPEKEEQRTIRMAIQLIEAVSKEPVNTPSFQDYTIELATGVLASLFAQIYERSITDKVLVLGRDRVITQSFRGLLRQYFKVHKSPAFYAQELHISVPYLSQAIRRVNGMSVSHWIQTEIIMEARRMLFHTDLSSKEIAFALGFDDHSYFTRFFTKKTGETPLGFRFNSRL